MAPGGKDAPAHGTLRPLCDAELDALVQLDVHEGADSSQSFLAEGIDLKKFSEETAVKLEEVEEQVIQETLREGLRYSELCADIDQTDETLKDMEVCLETFYGQIHAITTDIAAMQTEVQSMQTRLENRRAVEEQISQMLHKALVPPSIIEELANQEVTDVFIGHVEKLGAHSREVKKMQDSIISQQVRPALDTLTILLSSKLRTFLLGKVAMLSKPKTNISIIQQNVLLKYKPLMTFLLLNNGMVGQEVKDTYVQTLSQIYFKKAKNFLSKLTKLEKALLTPKDLITTHRKTDPADDPGFFFSFRSRDDWAKKWDAPIVVPYVDREKNRQHSYENLFRTMHLMLGDIITSEYIFSFDFFSDKMLFIPIFQKVITLFRESVQTSLPNVHDFLTLSSCVRLTNIFKATMKTRKIFCLDGYLESIHMLLWTQLETVVKANLQAVSAVSSHTTRVIRAQPLPLTHKFAEFSGVLLSSFQGQEAPATAGAAGAPPAHRQSEHSDRVSVLQALISSLLVEVNRVLHLDPSGVASMSERERQLFIASNLTLVRTTWDAYGVDPSYRDVVTVDGWLEGAKASLITLLIDNYLPNFVDVISKAEGQLRILEVEEAAQKEKEALDSAAAGSAGADGDGDGDGEGGLIKIDTSSYDRHRAAIDEHAVLGCAESFGRSWATRLPMAVTEVLSHTTGPLGADVASRLVMQLTIYNERLGQILTKGWLNPPCRNWLVSSATLLGSVNSVLEEYPGTHQQRQ